MRPIFAIALIVLLGACTTTEVTRVEVLDAWGEVSEIHTTTKTIEPKDTALGDVAFAGLSLAAIILALAGN